MKSLFVKPFIGLVLCVMIIVFLSGASIVQSRDNQKINSLQAPPPFPSGCIKAVDCDRWGTCWFGSWGGLYAHSPDDTWTIFTPDNSGLGHEYCTGVTVDENGYVWVAHNGFAGVSLLNHNGTVKNLSDDQWKRFKTSDGLGNNQAETVAIDPQGNKWIGHWSGISVLDDNGTPFTKNDDTWQEHPADQNGLANTIIRSIVFNLKDFDRAWAGGDNGFSRQKGPAVWERVTSSGGTAPWPGSDECPLPAVGELELGIWDQSMDHKGNLWVGTRRCYVSEFTGINWKIFEADNSDLPDEHIRSVAVDAYNNKWFGTENGVARLDNFDKWTVYKRQDGEWLTSDWIDSIDFDTLGNGWFGSCGDEGWISEYIPSSADTGVIDPGLGGTVYSPDRQTEINIPPGAVSETTVMTYTVEGTPSTGDLIGIRFFDLTAVISATTTPVTTTTTPYTITNLYSDDGIGTVIEDSMGLYYWDEGDEIWVQDGITSTLNITGNSVTSQLAHFSIFGVLGETKRLYLPLVTK